MNPGEMLGIQCGIQKNTPYQEYLKQIMDTMTDSDTNHGTQMSSMYGEHIVGRQGLLESAIKTDGNNDRRFYGYKNDTGCISRPCMADFDGDEINDHKPTKPIEDHIEKSWTDKRAMAVRNRLRNKLKNKHN